MCGIAGIVSVNPNEISETRLRSMTDSIAHRGPDGNGHWISEHGKVGFGHRRLSIIDLSESGKQPMHYMGRYTITFNGEIYNYIEIKESLIQKGYRFHSHSDTEVLMALYDLKKENCLEDLDGMFAFAIYDEKEQIVFCARDRFGEKPFHYYHEPGKCFVFGSEMKELWAAGIACTVNKAMLYNYIQFGVLVNPAQSSQTFYNHVYRLEHAHCLTVRLSTLQIQIKKYWDISISARTDLSLAQASDTFKELFYTSVKRRLRSDVPVGSSLSGGLDSSLVVCVIDAINQNKEISQKTFSAQFPGYEKDESRFQQMVIDQTKAEAYFTFPDQQTMLNEIDKVFYHQEEPFSSSSILAQYEVFRLAKANSVTVLLDGQGADEILAGYHSYFQYFFLEAKKNGATFQSQWDAYLKLHAKNPVNTKLNRGPKFLLRSAFPGAVPTLKKIKRALVSNRGQLSKDFYSQYKKDEVVFNQEYNTLSEVLKHSTTGGPLQELLRYADRNSMAHSREVRLPFLNHELVEFLFTLPPQMKIHNGWTKYLMRETFAHVLPKEIAWRVDKIGYEPPQKKWMQSPEVKEIIIENKQLLVNEGILDRSALSSEINPGTAMERGDNSWIYWMSGKLLKGNQSI